MVEIFDARFGPLVGGTCEAVVDIGLEGSTIILRNVKVTINDDPTKCRVGTPDCIGFPFLWDSAAFMANVFVALRQFNAKHDVRNPPVAPQSTTVFQ